MEGNGDMNIAGLAVKNTKNLFDKHSRMNILCMGSPKRGKTTMGATLDKLTKKHLGKPSLIVAIELGEGSGVASVRDLGVDYVEPSDLNEMNKLINALKNDTHYGGIVIDGTYELVRQLIKPFVLSRPSNESKSPIVEERRKMGVFSRSDYETAGEQLRQWLQAFINMTTVGDPKSSDKHIQDKVRYRKHLFVTALEKEIYEEDDNGKLHLTAIKPSLPGQMADAATAMFQTIGYITNVATRETNAQGKAERIVRPIFSIDKSDKHIAGDRLNLLPKEGGVEPDLLTIYENYWLPVINAKKEENQEESTESKESAESPV